ncbi:acyl-CoA 6-desaturase-like [Gigantopelta aegis]|uniref:acyl-CoA 6-desaturase-like n=1 Tax=Gigantopelta aegis TaxID=1735272 RepID=UPI001B88BF96|nr:acyl-CoA 6-desaturase-like [Gigantopelta aegis]
MCRDTKIEDTLPIYSLDEISKHNSKTDRWIAIDGLVYDVTQWSRRHPGGEKLLANHAGEDATDAWVAFHDNKEKVQKYLKSLQIGEVRQEDQKESELDRDWRELRRKSEEMNLFDRSVPFFLVYGGQIFFFELLGWLTLYYFGTGWIPYIVSALFLVTAQQQAGWLQHDFGHLAVFRSLRWNHIAHIFLMNYFKGVSSEWWNYRHYQHHAKPNIVRKDPDVRLEMVHMIGKTIPVEWGKKKKGYLPYQHQHKYFYFILPPLLLPIYFNFEVPFFLLKRKLWMEACITVTFFIRWEIMFSSFLGYGGALLYYLFVRFLESHWFVWTTQMNHIPMEVDHEKHRDWVPMQLAATCNVDSSLFNDWFTGHLNFQIEHHLFPTMPRHNYIKIQPLVKSLCKKHGLNYESKPLLKAFQDIVGSLKKSGELWYEAYNL